MHGRTGMMPSIVEEHGHAVGCGNADAQTFYICEECVHAVEGGYTFLGAACKQGPVHSQHVGTVRLPRQQDPFFGYSQFLG